MIVDLVGVITAVGTSGALVVGRDIWVARRTVKASEAAEKRNETREPLIIESILLGNTTKVSEIFQTALAELEDSKKRLAEELVETREGMNTKLNNLTEKLEVLRTSNEDKDKIIAQLYVTIGKMQTEINQLKGR